MSDEIELDYEYMAQRALRRVVIEALQLTAELGKVPGKHHFYIEFATGADGVEIPGDLKAAYPERMTIVLQHQFGDLIVNDDGFSVTLKFKGRPTRLVIPFEAVTAFSDPSASFGLRFDAALPGAEDADAAPSATGQSEARPPAPAAVQRGEGGGAEVVSLDKFRKK